LPTLSISITLPGLPFDIPSLPAIPSLPGLPTCPLDEVA
jgi:hypothetical protein